MGNSVKRNVPVCSDNNSKASGEGQDKVNLTRSINFRKVSAWNLGSLSDRLNWSFSGRSRSHTSSSKSERDKNRDRANSSRQYRKTTWPTPHTNSLFLSHFKRFSRNEEFIVEDVIAEGAFGIVFKVVEKQNPQQKYALKVFKKSKIIQDNSVQQIKDEIDIQKLCGHHPFIVKQIDSWQNRRNLHILLEYIPQGELFTKIYKFPYELIRLYIAEISLAIDFLHNAGIIYRDVKPENILLSSTYHIKITDFGLSKWLRFGERTRTMCGTFQYMAPEILRGEPYGHSIDWWAIGVVACRMLTDKYPNTKALIRDTGNFDVNEPYPHCNHFLPSEVNSIPAGGKDLLIRLLEQDPKLRLKSVLGLQKIAMYKDFKIEIKHVQNIVGCTFEGKSETSGLEGIKFRLDETGDISWYNDLISPLPESKGCNTCCESANVLFSCETFDVNALNPRLIFGAFAGHSIEFNTQTLTPDDSLVLECENWYSLLCKRLKEDQAVGQEKEFSFLNALSEGYFSDVVIKSSDGLDYHVHSVILRLNGFDCSMYCQAGSVKTERPKNPSTTNQVKISITIPNASEDSEQPETIPKLNLSPIYLHPPSSDSRRMQKMSNLSSSFNCLASAAVEKEPVESISKYHISSSDSNLQSNSNRNIFNFSNDLFLTPIDTLCSSRKPPLSPYRARSPSPFPSSLETPPSSPLTPIGVLHNLPSFILTPILHWLYTESLMPNMDEDTSEKIINFAETQPPLIKIVDPCRKYLKLIRLKKFVVDIIMDTHNVLNKIIQSMNPASISHQPTAFFNVYRDSLREGAVGCAKILQFCNIFIKDAADISRLQKHEIIKYVRTRLPIFMSQIHQLLRNLLSVFISLSSEEKSELIVYIVPKIESWLKILTNVIEEIKNSLEKMCKDLKCSHLDLSMNKDEAEYYSTKRRMQEDVSVFSLTGSAMYNVSNEKKLISADNDLKFVLYMYEVRKMRDIYGRIAAALDIIREKKSAFCEMNFANKKSTIHQNLEQLILDIPTYILLVENISDRLDDKIGWKEFKFCFKLATSQINGVIIKLLDHKSALSDPINHICKLVQKEEFATSLIDLGLLEPTNILQNDLKKSTENEKGAATYYDYKNIKLNLIKSLCEPPIVANSSLSKNALRLLHSGQLADMEFEVHVIQNSHGSSKENENYCRPTQIHTFRAHRVIVSARCEWFKKALLSGMQESINRKIIISDTSPVIFRRLLLYLYGAPIDKTVGAEQICELMLLADRYSIDDLKELCENTLNALIDEESVLCLLGIADRFMASVLKSNCLSFISQHASLTKSDMFKELPTSIQLEVQDLIQWYGRVPEPWSDGFKPRSSSRHSLKSPSKSRSRSRKSSPSFM